MSEEVIDLNDWLTVEQAAKRLANQGVDVSLPQLYQRSISGDTSPRRRVSIKSREIVGRLCLLKSDVDQYGQHLMNRRSKKKERERRAQT